ncbi:hypothetical protein BaRGS_00036454 [Batillaria attramentaria]|uniref:Sulfotransferase domain-containing protein n=1 Tax=Batillaria attramentaria TaxID=370345 RepID=A0ABD0JBX3_9CAEN
MSTEDLPRCAMQWKRRHADDPDIHIKKIHNMKLRDDDIFLCSFPKSGTHWVWRILDMVVNKSSEYSHRVVDAGFLDQQHVDSMENMASPRVMSTHLPLTALPKQVKARRTKLVHVYRDPKAVTVSLYFQWKTSGKVNDITMEKVVDAFNTEKALLLQRLRRHVVTWYIIRVISMTSSIPRPNVKMGANKNWFHWMDQVAEFERNHPEVPIFHVSYEELKLMADFLEVPLTRRLCQEISEAVSFSRQRQEENKRAGGPATFEKIFYRKGEISDWKNHLTVAQRERLDKAVRDRAHKCPFSAKYVPTSDNDADALNEC